MANVYVFFGPPSSGKSYLGAIFAKKHNFAFYEADDDYLLEYRERVKISEVEKQKVYNEFYTKVISRIKELLKQGTSVVVASALGKNSNRKRFFEELEAIVTFILVKSETNILTENAIKREFPNLESKDISDKEKKSLSEHLLDKISKFEEPDFECTVIHNDYTDKSIEALSNIKL